MPFKKNIFLLCIVIIGSILSGRICVAQKIELKDVVKIRLVERWGGASEREKNVEVINKNGIWKSYQTKWVKDCDPKTKGMSIDSSRIFIKNIPNKLLAELLSFIANPDTAIIASHFKLTDSLVKYTDTIHPSLTRIQKADFVNAIKTPSILHEALVYAMPILKDPDSGHYAISITTKANKNYILKAQKWHFASYLPWVSKSIKDYDPRIQDIFYNLSGDDLEAAEQRSLFYKNIDKVIYRKYFETRFNWELFQKENSESYRILNNSITPKEFIVDRHKPNTMSDYRQTYYFNSSLLPPYVNIYWDFYKTDTVNIRQFKKYEDTLANLFKRKNFLYDYLKNNIGVRAFVVKHSWDGMDETKKIMYNNIRKQFASIAFYDPSQMHFLRVVEADGNLSHWIVFGDKLVVLADYTGDLIGGASTDFKGIIPDPNSRGNHKNLKGVCLVFDNTGKRVGGTTDRVYIGWPF
jgi:hypothetical protein